MVTRSVSEGLLYPAFWVLSVRIEISVVGGATVGWGRWLSVPCGIGCGSPYGVRSGLWVGLCSSGTVSSGVAVSAGGGVIETMEYGGCAPLGVVEGGVFDWVFRKVWGVDPDPKVRVRFPAVVVEVIGLGGQGGSGGRVYR
jgi:hypothetical protein